MEKFNPHDKKYEGVKDLPEEQKDKFVDIPEEQGGGFVTKDAAEYLEGLSYQGADRATERMKGDALKEDTERTIFKHLLLEEKSIVSTIKRQGIKGLKKIYKKLFKNTPLYKQPDRSDTKDDFFIAQITERVLDSRMKTGVAHEELLSALIDFYISMSKDDFEDWNHTTCHLFERGGFLSGKSEQTITKIIDEVVSRSIKEGRVSDNVFRILGPLAWYNIKDVDVDNLDSDFSTKPDSLKNPEFISLFEDTAEGEDRGFQSSERVREMAVFCKAKTPREYFAGLIKQGINFSSEAWAPEKTLMFLSALKDNVSDEDMQSYINKHINPGITLEGLVENFAEGRDADSFVEGLYVDVEGTLIFNNQLMTNKVDEIKEKAKQGKKIVIFSGGSCEKLTARLREFGFPEEFLPVVSKSDFRGKILEEVLDDTPLEYQGFRAVTYNHKKQ